MSPRLLHAGTAESLGLAASPHVTVVLLLAIAGGFYLVLRRPQGVRTAGFVLAMLDGRVPRGGGARRGGSPRTVSGIRPGRWAIGSNATAAGLILALGLGVSLLTFPTACRCGADLPHEHALFELPGHHHDGQSMANDSTTGDARDYDGPVLRASDGSTAIGQPLIAAVHLFFYPPLRLLQAALSISDVFPGGLAVVPDPPPPRG